MEGAIDHTWEGQNRDALQLTPELWARELKRVYQGEEEVEEAGRLSAQKFKDSALQLNRTPFPCAWHVIKDAEPQTVVGQTWMGWLKVFNTMMAKTSKNLKLEAGAGAVSAAAWLYIKATEQVLEVL